MEAAAAERRIKPKRWTDSGPKISYAIFISAVVRKAGKRDRRFHSVRFTVSGDYPLIDVVRTIFKAFKARLPVNLDATVKALSDDIQAYSPTARKWQKFHETLGRIDPQASRVGNILREKRDKDRKPLSPLVPGSSEGPVGRTLRRLDEADKRRERPGSASVDPQKSGSESEA